MAGDEAVQGFFGEETGLDEDVVTTGTSGLDEGCELPPSRKPLPLNGIMFLMSCDPGAERE